MRYICVYFLTEVYTEDSQCVYICVQLIFFIEFYLYMWVVSLSKKMFWSFFITFHEQV